MKTIPWDKKPLKETKTLIKKPSKKPTLEKNFEKKEPVGKNSKKQIGTRIEKKHQPLRKIAWKNKKTHTSCENGNSNPFEKSNLKKKF